MTDHKRISKALSLIRYKDVLIFQAPAFIGLLMFLPPLSVVPTFKVLFLSIGTFLIMAFIFVFNDWADIRKDNLNLSKQQHTFLRKGVTEREMLILSIILAAAGALILVMISWLHLLLAFLIILFGIAYSYPIYGVKGKEIPFFSSFLHISTAVTAFLLGSTQSNFIERDAILIGVYLGILIMAGHLVQEVEDYEGDRHSNEKTNAVRYGQKLVFVCSFILFVVSFLYLYFLVKIRIFPNYVSYTVILYLVYIYTALKTYRGGLSRSSVRQLRSTYRKLFAVVVIILIISLLMARVRLPF